MAFSTKDRDNDRTGEKKYCAPKWNGGWWFDNCHYAFLNGVYHHSQQYDIGGVVWHGWTNYNSIKRAEMKIKPA